MKTPWRAYRDERTYRRQVDKAVAYFGEHEAPLQAAYTAKFNGPLWRAVLRRMKDTAA